MGGNPSVRFDFTGLLPCACPKCYIVCNPANTSSGTGFGLGYKHCWLEWGCIDPRDPDAEDQKRRRYGPDSNVGWGMEPIEGRRVRTWYGHGARELKKPYCVKELPELDCRMIRGNPPMYTESDYGTEGTCNSEIQQYLRSIGAPSGSRAAPCDGMAGWVPPEVSSYPDPRYFMPR